jgi:hypothetical protein
MLSLRAVPDPDRHGRNDLDPVLLIYGRGPAGINTLVSADDDGGGDYNSELFFVAHRGGTHRALATMYDDSFNGDNLGGYELAFHECPVLSLNPDTGTTRFTVPESPCVRLADGVAYSFLRIPVAPHERITVTTAGTGFTPRWQAFGPDMDTHGRLDGDWWSVTGNAPTTMSLGAQGGFITLAVGAYNPQSPSRPLDFTLRRQIVLP